MTKLFFMYLKKPFTSLQYDTPVSNSLPSESMRVIFSDVKYFSRYFTDSFTVFIKFVWTLDFPLIFRTYFRTVFTLVLFNPEDSSSLTSSSPISQTFNILSWTSTWCLTRAISLGNTTPHCLQRLSTSFSSSSLSFTSILVYSWVCLSQHLQLPP